MNVKQSCEGAWKLAPHQPLSFCLLSVHVSCRIIVCMYTTFNNEKEMSALRISSTVERMFSVVRDSC